MATKNNLRGGIVYSTDPSFKSPGADELSAQTLPPGEQRLRVRHDTKHRGGKAVTLVTEFVGPDADAEKLGKALKAFCGTGGAVKDGEIMIQGDNREKVLQWLLKNGYAQSKKI